MATNEPKDVLVVVVHVIILFHNIFFLTDYGPALYVGLYYPWSNIRIYVLKIQHGLYSDNTALLHKRILAPFNIYKYQCLDMAHFHTVINNNHATDV